MFFCNNVIHPLKSNKLEMKAISNIDRYLMVGIIGLAMILFVAYTQPLILNAFNIGDATPNGLLAKLGAILSIVGLFAFF